MATFTLEVPDSEVAFFTKLIGYLDFLQVVSVESFSEAKTDAEQAPVPHDD